jgi:hypothetical protein
MAHQELARIEASLRLLHRNRSTGMRLPRGPNIPLPADRTIASAGRESHDSVEQVPAWLTQPRRLEPMIMPPPPPGAGRKLHVGLSITLACFAGALAYYAFIAARPSQSGANFEITSAAPAFRASAPEVQGLGAFARVQPPEMEESASQISAAQIELARTEASHVIALSPAAMISERHSLPQPLPSAEESVASPQISSVPAVEPEEIDALIEQGRKFMANGDIVTARLLFKRAAKLENATAALALAAAYDPIVLSKLGVLGVDMDVEKARLWYQKAGELGSSQALERLRALAER